MSGLIISKLSPDMDDEIRLKNVGSTLYMVYYSKEFNSNMLTPDCVILGSNQ